MKKSVDVDVVALLPGWKVQRFPTHVKADLSAVTDSRRWIPEDYRDFLRRYKRVTSRDGGTWFFTAADFSRKPGKGFDPDWVRRLALEALAGDVESSAEVEAFWSAHLCVAMSVRDEYEYLALAKDGSLVWGQAIEPAEAQPLCASFSALWGLLERKGSDARLFFKLEG